MSFIQYLKDTKQEMAHTNWPSKKQVVNYTLLVVVVSVVVALFLTFSDILFGRGVNALLESGISIDSDSNNTVSTNPLDNIDLSGSVGAVDSEGNPVQLEITPVEQ